MVLGDHNSICTIYCLLFPHSVYKTSSVLAVHRSLSYVIISAHARAVSTDVLNYLCAVWWVLQQELPGKMPETDRVYSQGINEHIFSIQLVYLIWSVHSKSYVGNRPKLYTVPTWRIPVTVDQLLCWETGQCFSPLSHLTGVPGPAQALMIQCAGSTQITNSTTAAVTVGQTWISS